MTFVEAYEKAERRMGYIADAPKCISEARAAWAEIRNVHRQYVELCEIFPAKQVTWERDAIALCVEHFKTIKKHATSSEQSK